MGREGRRGEGTALKAKKMDGAECRGRREAGAGIVSSRTDGIRAEYRRRGR